MTVHMVRLFIEPPKGDAESAVDNWVQNHTEWVDDPVAHSLTETNTSNDGSGTSYVHGDYRFEQDETATTLLDNLEDRLSSLDGGLWYRIGYHACDHDEESGSSCEWDEQRESGNVPSTVADMTSPE